MNIERYVLEDANGHQHGTIFETIDEAREAAVIEPAVAIIALQFEYEDSELKEVWRYGVKTEEDKWPSK